jgi:hypothetical protein
MRKSVYIRLCLKRKNNVEHFGFTFSFQSHRYVGYLSVNRSYLCNTAHGLPSSVRLLLMKIEGSKTVHCGNPNYQRVPGTVDRREEKITISQRTLNRRWRTTGFQQKYQCLAHANRAASVIWSRRKNVPRTCRTRRRN